MDGQSQLIRPVAAGFAYAILAFAVGFALGTVRVFLVVPRVGATVAVLFEIPLILGASWWLSRSCVTYFKVSRATAARLVMGLAAFLALMLAEAILSVVLFKRPLTEYLVNLTTLTGAIGLAAQVAFASFPLAQARVV